jgi:hypothetical protein
MASSLQGLLLRLPSSIPAATGLTGSAFELRALGVEVCWGGVRGIRVIGGMSFDGVLSGRAQVICRQ